MQGHSLRRRSYIKQHMSADRKLHHKCESTHRIPPDMGRYMSWVGLMLKQRRRLRANRNILKYIDYNILLQ